MLKRIVVLLLFVHVSFSQESEYSVSFLKDYRIDYNQSKTRKEFKFYNPNNDLRSSGDIVIIGDFKNPEPLMEFGPLGLFEGKIGEMHDFYILHGSLSRYGTDLRNPTIKVGELLKRITYSFIGNKLNGLHYSGENYVVIIDNNLIDSSYKYYYAHRENPGFFVSNAEARFILNYKEWMGLSLENETLMPGIFSYPLPSNFQLTQHKDDELYYDLEKMISIFLEDFKSQIKQLWILHWERLVNRTIISRAELATETKIREELRALYMQINNITVSSYFEELPDNMLAYSYGIDNDDEIIIKVNPTKWIESKNPLKWYVLYHELGHDVLNLRHGQGGRMMFNFPTKNYSWEEFFQDRQSMFGYFFNKNILNNSNFDFDSYSL